MKYLFLDIDGVLNNVFYLYKEGIDCIAEEFLLKLRSIVNQTGAKIVLSSTWRIKESDCNLVKIALKNHGMELLDCTPNYPSEERGYEIAQWIDKNIENDNDIATMQYAILDDDKFAGDGHFDNFFLTKMDIGLTDEIAEKVVKHLNFKYDEIYNCCITDLDDKTVIFERKLIWKDGFLDYQQEECLEFDRSFFGNAKLEVGQYFFIQINQKTCNIVPRTRFWTQEMIDNAKIKANELIKTLKLDLKK